MLAGCPAIVAGWRLASPDGAVRDRSRRLIISSDDAGMCRSVNDGTIRGMTHGLITSASIMTCCPAFNEFADFAVGQPQFDYGVHLVLTCDLPEQPWGPVTGEAGQSLADDDGLFYWSPPDTMDIDEVEGELRAQIDRALSAGIRITHLDHHMWVMFRSPELLELYVRLGLDYDLPVRFARDVPRQIQSDEELATTYLQQLKILADADFPILDYIESDNYSVAPDAKRDWFLNEMRRFPSGITEIAAHCAVTGLPISPPDVEKREADLHFFTSAEAKECLQESRIRLVGWAEA